MTEPNPSTALARVIVDELTRHGVDFLVISPGSRSAALAIAAIQNDTATGRVLIDERSAAYCALGRAKATGMPAAVISTSGTAPANFMPAVVEADMSLTPLLVISADRPAEMRGVGANQTIDQVGMYGDKVRLSATIEAPGPERDLNDEWRTVVSRAVMACLGRGGKPGPVHLNVAFREPTVPVPDDGRSQSPPYPHPIDGEPGGGPWMSLEVESPPPPQLEVPASPRGLVIAGEGVYDRGALLSAAGAVGWPVLATALSGMRGRGVISRYHHILADGVPVALRPEVVVAVGSIGPSQRLEELTGSARYRFRVDYSGRNIDPGRNATAVVHADPVGVLRSVVGASGDADWARAWTDLDRDVGKAVHSYLASSKTPSGPGVAAALNEVSWETLVAASSLPIRDVDSQLEREGSVIANRGASGIDGFVSTCLGVASARPGTVAMSGDLSLLHDINGFLGETPDDLVMVVIDNNGGGLFDLLPQATHAPGFERLFITPHDRSIRAVARLHDLAYEESESVTDLPAAITRAQEAGGIWLIRVAVDRSHDVGVRESLDAIGAELAKSAQA